ncbi:MAG TPA: hypothetical protein VGR73_23300 [Bryobacteraceae bacterium]|nr:hypothetical protein [Bryobacteraceae bacterium]
MSLFPYLLPGVQAALQVFLAILLLRGHFRSYSLLFLFCCANLIANVADGIALYTAGVGSVLYRNLYWTGDVVDELLQFLLVITLTYAVMEGNPMRPGVGRMLAIVAGAAAVLPFVLYRPYFTGAWFRHTSQLLSLGAAFMNLLLWTAIVGRKGKRDHQLLMVSAGVGVAVTGLAVSYGVLQFMTSQTARGLADLFKALTQVGGNVVWCWAFWPAFAHREADPPRTGHSPAGHPAVERAQS